MRQEGGEEVNNADILAAWEQTKDTAFGKWLTSETEKATHETTNQFMQFSELAPLLRVQGFRAGVKHWQELLAEARRQHDLEVRKSKSGILARIGLGGHT